MQRVRSWPACAAILRVLAWLYASALIFAARYRSGYLGDIGIEPVDIAMNFHAWFEANPGGDGIDSMHGTASRV